MFNVVTGQKAPSGLWEKSRIGYGRGNKGAGKWHVAYHAIIHAKELEDVCFDFGDLKELVRLQSCLNPHPHKNNTATNSEYYKEVVEKGYTVQTRRSKREDGVWCLWCRKVKKV